MTQFIYEVEIPNEDLQSFVRRCKPINLSVKPNVGEILLVNQNGYHKAFLVKQVVHIENMPTALLLKSLTA